MITEQWLKDNAAVVPDDAPMFVRHPRHYIIKIKEIGWTRFTAQDGELVWTGNAYPWPTPEGEPYRSSRQSIWIQEHRNPNRIIEHSVSAERLMERREEQEDFRKQFGEDSIPASLDLIRATFPDAAQIILKLKGGASWFIWGLEEGVL